MLIISLKIFKVEFRSWQPVVASILAGLSAAFIPNNGAGLVSLAVLWAVMRWSSGNTWEDLFLPIAVTRLSLVPVLILVGTW